MRAALHLGAWLWQKAKKLKNLIKIK